MHKPISTKFTSAALAFLLTAELASALPGQSVGRWRVPSTYPQILGYGWGGGYHAPMVRYPLYQPAPIPRVVYGTQPSVSPFCGHPYTNPSGGYSAEGGSAANYFLAPAPRQLGAVINPPTWGSSETPAPASRPSEATGGELVPTPPAVRPER